MHVFLLPFPESASKRHVYRFSRFCGAYPCDQQETQTGRQTTLRATSVAIGRIYTMHAMWPNSNGVVDVMCALVVDVTGSRPGITYQPVPERRPPLRRIHPGSDETQGDHHSDLCHACPGQFRTYTAMKRRRNIGIEIGYFYSALY